MAYKKVGWKNYPDKTTKMSAENFDHMDSQIKTNADNIGDTVKIEEIDDGTLSGAVINHEERLLNLDEKIKSKQDILLCDTYVSTNIADGNGAITLGIDISSLKLSEKPKTAFLQGQNAGFYSIEKYIYSYDSSTKDQVVFVVSYGSSASNKSITDRYGFVIIT